MAREPDEQLFRTEYERELESWLRDRFKYLCLTYVVIQALFLVASVSILTDSGGAIWRLSRPGITAVESTIKLIVIGGFLAFGRRLDTRRDILRLAGWLVFISATISLAAEILADQYISDSRGGVLLPLFAAHFFACLFLPWSPRESIRPIVPVFVGLVAYLLLESFQRDEIRSMVFIVLAPAVLLPGLALCSWRLHRHRRAFSSAMLGRHFVTTRREYAEARRIHESLFPDRYDDGYVRLEYSYTPMRQLGGDFLHLAVSPEGLLYATLVDVTGHGLPAALTVNRIHGELERIRGESPHAEPVEVMRLLNRYFNLTLSRHSIYATAACLAIDPYESEARCAIAGHPPLLLRTSTGQVKEISSTGVVLGALKSDEFICEQCTTPLAPDDMLLGYTDGAFEASDRRGERMGIGTLRELLQYWPAPGNWPQFLASFVEKHQDGRAQDDVLIAAITFLATRDSAPR